MLTKTKVVAVSSKDSKRERFRLDGWLGRERVRLALRTERKADALRITHKIEMALAEGNSSTLWEELLDQLPRITFDKFAGHVGWRRLTKPIEPPKSTWEQLRTNYNAKLAKEFAKGNLRESTRERYLQTLKHFDRYLLEKRITSLPEITKNVIEDWKIHRIEEIKKKPNSRGGTGYVLDVAILRAVFNFAVSEKTVTENPVRSEGKPGARPSNGASPFSPEELIEIMKHAEEDRLAVLVLFRTGLRRSDAISLKWKNIDLKNEQISLVAQKNNKKVKVPILPDLLAALRVERTQRDPSTEDSVLFNPATGKPYTGRQLYKRCKAIGKRAAIANVRPHRFRDSFAADAFLRGCDTEEVAAYLADTVATVAEHYAEFIEERRKRADAKMRTGSGLVVFTHDMPVDRPKPFFVRRSA
jgi:type 1 fimbriae regulatory protein FimB